MTILSVAQLASTVIGVAKPSTLLAATDDTSIQIVNALNEAAQMVAFDAGHDWTKLKALATYTGDGSTLAFNLPSDYSRMLKKTRLWPSWSPFQPIVHYPDTDEWLGLQVQGWRPVLGGWTIIGTQINFMPAIPAGATVQHYYMRNTIVSAGDGSVKTSFTADDDTFQLGERLLRLAFIYRWKQDRGLDYGEALEDFETAKGTHIGNDKGTNILTVGRQRVPDSHIAFPGALGS